MSRLLTPGEIKALRAGPILSEAVERIRIGDPVEVVVDGLTLAHGRLISQNGRVCVRIERLVAGPESEKGLIG